MLGGVENDVQAKAVEAVIVQLIDECSFFVCSFQFSKTYLILLFDLIIFILEIKHRGLRMTWQGWKSSIHLFLDQKVPNMYLFTKLNNVHA